MKHKPHHVKEAERLLIDCGLCWCNALDLYRIRGNNPDLADVVDDILDWLLH